MLEESDDEKDRQANELRNLIGKLPSLSIFIDEVHHAVSDEIKLRAVVNKWAENKTVNSVIGFSGTPYLEKAEKIKATAKEIEAEYKKAAGDDEARLEELKKQVSEEQVAENIKYNKALELIKKNAVVIQK